MGRRQHERPAQANQRAHAGCSADVARMPVLTCLTTTTPCPRVCGFRQSAGHGSRYGHGGFCMSALFQTIAGWFSSRMAPAAAAALPVRLGGRGSFSATTTPARVHGFDQPLVWVVVTLLLWGLVMVYSVRLPCRTTRALPTIRTPISWCAMWCRLCGVCRCPDRFPGAGQT